MRRARAPSGRLVPSSGDRRQSNPLLFRRSFCHFAGPHPSGRSAGTLAVDAAAGASPARQWLKAVASHAHYSRAVQSPEVAEPRSPRGRTAKHDPDPLERAFALRRREPRNEGDRPRSRDHRGDAGAGGTGRRHHGSGAPALRHRAQAARRLGSAAGDQRRRHGDDGRLRPLEVLAAVPAAIRFPRSDRRQRSRTPSASRRPT